MDCQDEDLGARVVVPAMPEAEGRRLWFEASPRQKCETLPKT
jgi:hypothetical protein